MLSGTQSEALRKLIHGFHDKSQKNALKAELLWLKYFTEAREFTSGRELEQIVANIASGSASDITRARKGAILYRSQDKNDCGYFLLSGAVAIYSGKTDGERTQWIKRNKKLNAQAKVDEAVRLTGFAPQQIVSSLIETFIDDKIQFGRCNYFHTVNAGEYFGFAEMVKLGYRPFSAVALEDCVAITIPKSTFERYMVEYQKMKQSWMIELLSNRMDQEILVEVKSMFAYLIPYIILKECTNEQVLFREGEHVIDTYLIVRGELETFKNIELIYPKQYANRQLKSIKSKTVYTTVARSISGELLGEEELVVNCRTRNFSVKSLSGDTLLLKIDSSFFLKLLNERYDILKVVSKKAKEKMALYNQNYLDLSKKIMQGFRKQFRDYEEKKQDILVEKVVGQDRITSQEIQCLKEQQPGLFFRDTFEKIQKMDLWSGPGGNLKAKTKRQKPLRGASLPLEQHLGHIPLDLDITTHERMLFSTKKNVNQAELMVNFLAHQGERAEQRSQMQQHRRSTSSSPPVIGRLSLKSFKADTLKMDDATHKRVLIKRGLFKKQIDQNYQPFKVASAFQDNFRPVIESCITRKNGSINKIEEKERRREVVDMNYRTIVKKCRNKSEDGDSLEPVRMFHSWTIKDLRKTFSTMSKHRTSRQMDNEFSSPIRSTQRNKNSHKQILEQFDCIIAPSKIKRQGKFSYEAVEYTQDQHVRQYYTAQIKRRLEFNKTMPKLVLLNHMMKPIAYK